MVSYLGKLSRAASSFILSIHAILYMRSFKFVLKSSGGSRGGSRGAKELPNLHAKLRLTNLYQRLHHLSEAYLSLNSLAKHIYSAY